MPMFKKKPVVIEANQFDGTLAAKKTLEDDSMSKGERLAKLRSGLIPGPTSMRRGISSRRA